MPKKFGMSKIVGFQKLAGEFKGHPYSNYRLTVLEPYTANEKDCVGYRAKTYSGKTELVDRWMAENKLNQQTVREVEVKFYFDEYGKINQIQRG